MSNVQAITPQRKYEYQLPQDAPRLAAEAVVSATYVFLHDCLASRSLSKAEIEAQAILGCQRTKESTVDKACTNDFNLFTKLSMQYYTEAYLAIQNHSLSHPQELEAAKLEIQNSEPSQYLHALASSVEADFKKRGLL